MRTIREPVNFFTHFIPALISVIAGYFLLKKCDTTTEITAGIIYSLCTFILFGVSAFYHGYPSTIYGIKFWQKFDHCCIYLMIAGSYTPTALLVFEGWLSLTLFVIVWLIAIIGCLLKIFNRLKSNGLSLAVYILMGCLIIPLLGKMLVVLPISSIMWLILGGVFYVVGTYFYAKDKQLFKYAHSHEIWHFFVIAGAFSHYVYNYSYIFELF